MCSRKPQNLSLRGAQRRGNPLFSKSCVFKAFIRIPDRNRYDIISAKNSRPVLQFPCICPGCVLEWRYSEAKKAGRTSDEDLIRVGGEAERGGAAGLF